MTSGPLWVIEQAARFWSRAGGPEPFPRTLRRGIARSAPLSIVSLSRLHVAAIEEWLEQRAGRTLTSGDDRLLRACLVAGNDHGLIFVDGDDPDDEQRFSVAHELAHFLCDYQAPRSRASERLGAQIVEVLDGKRAPTPSERFAALLRHVELQTFVHLMERTPTGHHASEAISKSEASADRLAFELLAPAEAVLSVAGSAAVSPEIVRLLMERFGLPSVPAGEYAALLGSRSAEPSPLLRRLRAQT